MTVAELVQKVQTYDPSLDGSWLMRVYEVADQAHEGQRRASGESYIEHPLAVAGILADLEMDRQTIAAAILHDVVEDTSITAEQVSAQFGEEIGALVEGVTKLTRIPYQSKEEAQVENLRKMFMAMAKDIRVIIIKLADRLHNMRTLASLPPAKQTGHCPRNAGHLYADRAPAGHLEDQVGDGRSLSSLHRPRRLSRDRGTRCQDAQRSREHGCYRRKDAERRIQDAGHPGRDSRPPQTLLFDLHEDEEGPRFLDHLRPLGNPHHRGIGQRLLRGAGNRARVLDTAARALQRLHRDAQAQHVPVVAHNRRRARGRSARDSDPHLGDAPHQRIRHRSALALQRGRQGRSVREQTLLAARAA